MKTLLVSLTLLLAVAVFVNANPDHQLPPRKQAAVDVCLKKLGLTEEEFRESKEGSEGDNDRGCLFVCIDKELGLMTANGNIDRDAAIEDFPPFVAREERTRMVDSCLEQKGADECETAKLYHTCLNKLIVDPDLVASMMKMQEVCKDELSLTDEELEKMMHPTEDVKKNCYRACVMKALGFFNKNGTINKESYVEKTPLSSKELARKIADSCANEVGADECETAALFYNCITKYYFMIAEGSGPTA